MILKKFRSIILMQMFLNLLLVIIISIYLYLPYLLTLKTSDWRCWKNSAYLLGITQWKMITSSWNIFNTTTRWLWRIISIFLLRVFELWLNLEIDICFLLQWPTLTLKEATLFNVFIDINNNCIIKYLLLLRK